jgi:alkylation response protein AidB-like acyl-CoA dehydrogenase
MHLVILLNIVRRWRAAVAAADQRRIAAFGGTMEAIARDGVVIAAAISELGQELARPRTRATRTESAKTFVNEGAARIVDRAMALSGGAGYLNGHPLARAYRDVRAGSFMHPLGANRAYDFLGDVALGREPVLR